MSCPCPFIMMAGNQSFAFLLYGIDTLQILRSCSDTLDEKCNRKAGHGGMEFYREALFCLFERMGPHGEWPLVELCLGLDRMIKNDIFLPCSTGRPRYISILSSQISRKPSALSGIRFPAKLITNQRVIR